MGTSQLNALAHIHRLSAANDDATAYIGDVVKKYGLSRETYEKAIHYLLTGTRIAIHFHPDRLTRSGKSVVTGMRETGNYLSQFETGISNGSPSAFAGGERDIWERHLFGGAYHASDVSVHERPKYGALQVFPYPDGPSPRFGSCYFLLCRDTLFRSTFTFGGSHETDALSRTGTIDHFDPVLAALLNAVEKAGCVFGRSKLAIPAVFELLARQEEIAPESIGTLPLGRVLDSFIEVQIHGEIDLRHDVAMLVCDPSYHDTVVGRELITLSADHGFPVYWHSGFKLPVEEVPRSFRGYEIRTLAERISRMGMIDPAVLGEGANAVLLEPERWIEFGNGEEITTRFRRLWHAMVIQGRENAG